LKRHKQQTDDAERIEEDLKQERRRLQREVNMNLIIFFEKENIKDRVDN
jgi:hypothetical protein